MMAAGLGNTVADVVGINISHTIEVHAQSQRMVCAPHARTSARHQVDCHPNCTSQSTTPCQCWTRNVNPCSDRLILRADSVSCIVAASVNIAQVQGHEEHGACTHQGSAGTAKNTE
jgi:hypothetical protein